MSGRTHQIQSINSCLVSINEVQCFLKEILQWVKINKIIHKWINFYSMDALSCNAIKKGNILWKAHTWYSQVSVQACHNLVSDECIHTLKIYPKMYHTMCKSFFQPLSPLTPTRKKKIILPKTNYAKQNKNCHASHPHGNPKTPVIAKDTRRCPGLRRSHGALGPRQELR